MRKPPSVSTKSGSLGLTFADGFATLGVAWLLDEDPDPTFVLLLVAGVLGEGADLMGELDPLSSCF